MVRQEFFFIAGAAALDFLNTEIVSSGRRVDLLDSSGALSRWLAAAGLASGAVSPRALRDAKALRAMLRAMFERRRPTEADTARLNEFLLRTRGRYQLRGGRLDFVPDDTPDPVWLIARAAAEFLTTADLSLVRQCEGTGCILFFYDTTKSHSRRWCSMAMCGNRMKAAAFYERSKER